MSKSKKKSGGSVQPPSVGRIVHYVPKHGDDIKVLPAIIVAVGDDDEVNLKIFTDSGGVDEYRQKVAYDADKSGFTWHWPETKLPAAAPEPPADDKK